MSSRTTLLIAGALFVGAPHLAQAQTATGASCPGFSGLVPGISNDGLAIFGETWDLELTGLPLGFGYLAIGFSDTFSPSLGAPLPLDLGLLFADPAWAGCDLNVDFGYAIAPVFLNGIGEASFTFPGFHAPAKAYFQFIAIDADLVGFTKFPGASVGWCMTGREPSGVAPGDLVITEIMKDSTFAFDANGEWFEIKNTTAGPIDIDGFVLSDDGGDLHVIDNGGPLLVPAGGYLVLGIDANCFANGGVALDYSYGSTASFFLANSDDEVILSDFNSKVIDRVAYDNGATFPDEEGRALALDVAKIDANDNDVGANWAPATCPLGQGCGLIYNADRGTPGAANDSCNTPPAPVPTGALIFVEIMKDPVQAPDEAGEWFEIVNTTGTTIDLDGYVFSAGLQTFIVAGGLNVAPGGRQLFMRDDDPIDNGGIDGAALGAYEYDPNLGGLWNMGNSDETLRIFDAVGALVGELSYDGGTVFPDTEGVAMGLDPAITQTHTNAVIGANWCNQTSTVPGGTDLGTPGAPNDPCVLSAGCPGTGEIICTEFMQNPAALADAAGEWIELYNTTGTAIDIDGWVLRDDGTDSHTINNGGPLLVPAGGYLTLASSASPGFAPGYVYSGFSLSNSTDEIVLVQASNVVCCIHYDNGATYPDGNGAAAQLDPSSLDVASAANGANWSLATQSYNGDLGTPGSANTP